MSVFTSFRSPAFFACMFLLPALTAYSQTTLTGAIQFSTNSSGASSLGQIWNTLPGDSRYDLWLALEPNAARPINGPSDSQAAISIPLASGNRYRYYIFGQPGGTNFEYSGLNLFFDGNDSTPGISVFGPLDALTFYPNSSSTLTLQSSPVAGSGTSFYVDGSEVAVLSEYDWHTPTAAIGDVCTAETFTPGDGNDYFGSFTVDVFPAASLSTGQSSGSPGTKINIIGSGFMPSETVDIYAGVFGSAPLGSAIAGPNGSFATTVVEPQHPDGPLNFFALGQTSGKLGVVGFAVTPGVVADPEAVEPGANTTASGLGFAAGETVDVYLDNPRQLLGTTAANALGSFIGGSALVVAIPANTAAGLNAFIGIGQTSGVIGIGKIRIE